MTDWAPKSLPWIQMFLLNLSKRLCFSFYDESVYFLSALKKPVRFCVSSLKPPPVKNISWTRGSFFFYFCLSRSFPKVGVCRRKVRYFQF